MIAHLTSALKIAVYGVYARYFTFSTLVEGDLRGCGTACRCLMLTARNSPFENYLLRRMFGDTFRRIRTKRAWIPWLGRRTAALPPDVDFCVAALPARWDHAFSRRCALKSPAIVHQAIDLAGDWSDLKKRLHRKKREVLNRFMSKSPYSTRISRELGDFDRFYHRMYVPHTLRQFETSARVDSYETVKRYFMRGFLLILSEAGEDVAGSVCYVQDDRFVFHRGGVLDGDEAHVRNGAQSASYVAMITQAKAMDLKVLDVGHSRAFFDDGVYRHKREWGASVCVDPDLDSWMYVFDPNHSEKCASFLRHNPLIVHTTDGLMAYSVAEPAADDPAVDVAVFERRFHAPGVNGLLLAGPGPATPETLRFG
jgi:hypothetical protein